MLTLIRMAGGIYDSQKFEKIQLKMALSNFLYISHIYSSQNVSDLNIVKCFKYKKFCFRRFNQKLKSFHLFVVFLCIPAGWESYMNPKRPIGVGAGGEALTGSPP
jgi:hypothetical protein